MIGAPWAVSLSTMLGLTGIGRIALLLLDLHRTKAMEEEQQTLAYAN